MSFLAWSPCASAAGHEDQPLALETLAAGLPFDGSDLRIGAGVAFYPTRQIYPRLDVVEHAAGLTLNHKVTVMNVLELSVGAGVYYEFTTQRVRPVITLARILF